MTENEDVFNKVEEPKKTIEESNDFSEESESDELSFSDKSAEDKQKDYGEHINCNGQTLTIMKVVPMLPKLTTYENNEVVKIKPTESKNKKSHYYTAKLKILYSNNVVAYLPTITYFCDVEGNLNLDNKGKPIPVMNFNGHNQVSILCKKVLNILSGNKFTFKNIIFNQRPSIIANDDCIEAFKNFAFKQKPINIARFLIGKQVKIKTEEGINDKNNNYFRNDIEAFV